MKAVACRHCERVLVIYSRRLCRFCWADPDVRSSYPLESGMNNQYSPGRKAIPDVCRSVDPLPEEPTGAWPGSPEKVAVMEQRARAQTSLFHPEDPVIVLTLTSVFASMWDDPDEDYDD